MKEYCITYWTERYDCATDVEIIIKAFNEEEAIKQFYEMNLVHKKIDNIRVLV